MPTIGSLQKNPHLLPIKNDHHFEQPKEQATRILYLLKKELASNPECKIALIYSANNSQAEELHEAILNNDPAIPKIYGGGQAILFMHLIKKINELVDKKQLAPGRIRVLPVSTSLIGGEDDATNSVTQTELDRDILQISMHLEMGYTIYGIPRNNNYAIGGGISAHFYQAGIKDIEGKSQGHYVQHQLSELEQGYPQQKEPLGLTLTDHLILAREVGNKEKWNTIKQDLIKLAEAAENIDDIDPEVSEALKEHWNDPNSIRRWFNFFFHDDKTTSWLEVEGFYNNKQP